MTADYHTLEILDLRKLTVQQRNAIDALILGCSDREAGEAANVDRSTVARWRLYHPAFQAELENQRAAMWAASKEKLRALIPEAVDVVRNAIRDPTNEDRAKLALDLIKSIKLSEDLAASGRREADAIIKAEASTSPFSMLSDPSKMEIRRRELQIHAHLNGLTYAELDAILAEEREREDAEERARRKAEREAKKAAKASEVVTPTDAPPEVLSEPDGNNAPCPCHMITVQDAPSPCGDPELPVISCEVDQ
jgi:hypothetical protein